MQLRQISVTALFGRLNHTVIFPEAKPEAQASSLVILHGDNGIGKTTLLRMLAGMMDLDFDVFRSVPFQRAELTFSTGKQFVVTGGNGSPVIADFDGQQIVLHPDQKGSLDPSKKPLIDAFRAMYAQEIRPISFEFISAPRQPLVVVDDDAALLATLNIQRHALTQRVPVPTGKIRRRSGPGALAGKVSNFVLGTQANFRRFFATREPTLLERVIQTIEEETPAKPSRSNLIERLKSLTLLEADEPRLGLGSDIDDYNRIAALLQRSQLNETAETILGVYLELLELRAAERGLIASRLRGFERIVGEFLHGKRVLVSPDKGLTIISSHDGAELTESQLSSGEYNLLYLLVSALVATSRGTVLAIDEPEMSMHIAWQRRLIRTLFDCASSASPQFICATHSPDIAADYPQSMVLLGPQPASEQEGRE